MDRKKLSPGAPACAARGSESNVFPTLRFDHTPSPLALQVRILAARFGVAPGVAEALAAIIWQTGAAT